MNARQDLSRVALGAATLHEVFIVSVPDCLLVKTWSRTPRADGEGLGAHLGQLHGIARELLEAIGAQGTSTTLTLETEDALLLISGVSRDLIAALVFDRASPLGLARLQSTELIEQIRGSLEASALPPQQSAPQPSAPQPTTPQPPAPSPPPRVAPPPPARRPPPAPAPAPTSHADDLTELPRPRFEADTARGTPGAPPVNLAPPRVEPSIAPTVAPPPSAPAPPPAPAAPAAPARRPPPAPPVPPPAAITAPGITAPLAAPPRARAARLIEVLRQSAPDPHASLLRLSLRTGIPLDALERPETLADAQVDAIATSVRDLLGREVAV